MINFYNKDLGKDAGTESFVIWVDIDGKDVYVDK